MKAFVVSLFTAFLGSNCWASPVEIDSKIFFKGQKLGSPRILTEEGVTAKIQMTDGHPLPKLSLEIEPHRKQGSMQVTYKLAVLEGKNETISRGSIRVEPQKTSRISIDKGEIEIHLKIKKS